MNAFNSHIDEAERNRQELKRIMLHDDVLPDLAAKLAEHMPEPSYTYNVQPAWLDIVKTAWDGVKAYLIGYLFGVLTMVFVLFKVGGVF